MENWYFFQVIIIFKGVFYLVYTDSRFVVLKVGLKLITYEQMDIFLFSLRYIAKKLCLNTQILVSDNTGLGLT